MIKNFDDLLQSVKDKPKKRVIVVKGEDPNTIEACIRASEEDIAEIILVGDTLKIEKLLEDLSKSKNMFKIVHAESEIEAARIAVELIKKKEGDILMKGLIGTEKYMKAILNKENGLLSKGNILSHLTLIDVPAYDKFLFLTDVAVLPAPDLMQKTKMIEYAVNAAHRFGIDNPKVAILAANEKISDRMPATQEAAILSMMNKRKQITGCIVDGPLALDVAISPESCSTKGLDSPVGGDADILVFPDIEAANIFYKCCAYFASARLAAIVFGSDVPCILTSRSDSDESKFLSIVLACQVA